MHLLNRALAATAIAVVIGPAAAHAWEPDGTVEFVVPYSSGGGSDVNARALVDTIRQNDLVGQNITILNRPGGSGAVGNAYTFSKSGSGTTISTFNSGQMMATIVGDASVKLENLTPIGTLALDTLMLVVPADSDLSDLSALVEEATANPGEVTIGGSARGSEDNLVVTMLDDAAEGEFQYVPFGGGGEVLAALLGGHIDAGVANPSEVASQVEAGRLEVLGSFSKERLAAPLDDVPTFIEQGYPDVSFTMFRGYVGPPEMPEEAVAYWEDVLMKASETERWKEGYVEQNGLTPASMGAEESKQFYESEAEKYRKLLSSSGFLE